MLVYVLFCTWYRRIAHQVHSQQPYQLLIIYLALSLWQTLDENSIKLSSLECSQQQCIVRYFLPVCRSVSKPAFDTPTPIVSFISSSLIVQPYPLLALYKKTYTPGRHPLSLLTRASKFFIQHIPPRTSDFLCSVLLLQTRTLPV